MKYVFRAPGVYYQDFSAIKVLDKYIESFGGRPMFVNTNGGYERYIKDFIASKTHYHSCIVDGKATPTEVSLVIKFAKEHKSTVLVGFGGGKIIDTARAAADQLDVSLIIVPSVASNDSPCSALSILRNDDDSVAEVMSVKRNPDLVLVDTQILLAAPRRFLIAGIGDALATYFEAVSTDKAGSFAPSGGRPSVVSLALAKLCYDILLEDSYDALIALDSGIVNDSFDRLIQAVVFLSGVGFENNGCAFAHSVCDGLSFVPEASGLLHGEAVAFGTFCQLILSNEDSDTIRSVACFMSKIGLPLTFEQLGLTPDDAMLKIISEHTVNNPNMQNIPIKLTAADVIRTLVKADYLGREYLENN